MGASHCIKSYILHRQWIKSLGSVGALEKPKRWLRKSRITQQITKNHEHHFFWTVKTSNTNTQNGSSCLNPEYSRVNHWRIEWSVLLNSTKSHDFLVGQSWPQPCLVLSVVRHFGSWDLRFYQSHITLFQSEEWWKKWQTTWGKDVLGCLFYAYLKTSTCKHLWYTNMDIDMDIDIHTTICMYIYIWWFWDF